MIHTWNKWYHTRCKNRITRGGGVFHHKVEWRMEERERERKKTAWDKEWSNLLQFPSGVSPVTCPKHIPVTHLSRIKHTTHKATHACSHPPASPRNTHKYCVLLKKTHRGAARHNHADLLLATEQLHWSWWGLLQIARLPQQDSPSKYASPCIFRILFYILAVTCSKIECFLWKITVFAIWRSHPRVLSHLHLCLSQEPPLRPCSTPHRTSCFCTSRVTSAWWQQVFTLNTKVC